MSIYIKRDLPLARSQMECLERLSWLYGDPTARIAHNQPDLMKWRQIGGEVYAPDVASPDLRFSRAAINIAKGALA